VPTPDQPTPPVDSPGQVTRLLTAAAQGEANATEQLLPLIYNELRQLAGSMMRSERVGHTLQPTALVHEAYLRLLGPSNLSWENRAHFFGAAAQAMRRILIDRARHIKSTRVEKNALPLGTALLESTPPAGGPEIDPDRDADELIHLDAALDALRAKDERQHEVVMLRSFAGLTIEQTALAMGLSAGTIKNEWAFARAWLMREIERRAASS